MKKDLHGTSPGFAKTIIYLSLSLERNPNAQCIMYFHVFVDQIKLLCYVIGDVFCSRNGISS